MNPDNKKQLLQVLLNMQHTRLSIICSDLCKTTTKDVLDTHDQICLVNCGYNQAYIKNKRSQIEKDKILKPN